MNKQNLLLLGGIKEENSMSMKNYVSYLKKLCPEACKFEPSAKKIKPSLFKNFFYPFIIPRNYNIYHITDHSYGHLAYFLPKDKLVITCHDLIQLKTDIGNWKSNFSFRYYLSGLKRAEKIICISENTKNDLIKELKIFPEKIVVVPPISINRQKFKKIKIKREKFLRNKFVILHIGSFKYKNTLTLLKSLKILKEQLPEIIFLKIGKFDEFEKKFIIKNNLQPFIINREHINEDELVKAYNSSDVLVFPSIYEGFGIPPLEAMACEVPVIASNVSSLPEVVGDAGILVNPLSVENITSAIKNIKIKKGLKENLIKKGLKNLERFSEKRNFNAINKIYKEVLRKNVRNKRI